MRLGPKSRVAVIGAGPGGVVAAKHLIEAGISPTVFEASDDLGGQWYVSAPHSGVWPGMRTNTSRAMTAFSDGAVPNDHELHPRAEQIHAYLRSYASAFDVTPVIRTDAAVHSVEPGWVVDGERFDAVVVASGRFRRPFVPPGLGAFTGRLLHAYDYPGAQAFRDGRTLVYGNGVSGHEIAADIATVSPVISSFRKPRYVLPKNVAGVSSDWQWYTYFGVLQRRSMPRDEFGSMLRDHVVRVAGHPADFGAPPPDDDILVAGHSLSQDYLQLVGAGRIRCLPGIAHVDGRTVTFTDGTVETVDTIVCATGYHVDIPYLGDDVWRITGPQLALHHHTVHPDLPGLGFIGQFALQGPYFPLLELQARWIAGLWSGQVAAADDAEMRLSVARAPDPVVSHNVLAVALSEAMGVAPDLAARPDLAEPLIFGPMLPVRYRLDGPGSRPDAAERFRQQLAASPRAAVDLADLALLDTLGLGHLVPVLT